MKQRTYLHHFYSPSKLTRDSLFYIESVGHYRCDKSFFEDSYYKQNYYLIYVASGKGYVCSQEEKNLVGPGQLAFLNLKEPYKYHPHKKNPMDLFRRQRCRLVLSTHHREEPDAVQFAGSIKNSGMAG